ncbi:hypothetical protein BBP40_007902 [Aspergillus hancockii]|nr:hypothetical protein BBP40_007902 [Aspergillus hancockii]
MPQRHHPVSWREKRKALGSSFDPKKRSKAERERYRRGKKGAFKGLNNLHLDAIESGRERRIYVVVLNKPKGRGSVRYATYNTHPHEDWVPPAEEVAEHWPKTDKWTPDNFKEKKEEGTTATSKIAATNSRRLYNLSKPPTLNLLSPTLI